MNIHNGSLIQQEDVPFAMYDAFTDVPYSGSQAAIILNASNISSENRARIAREIGAPATAFVNAVNGNRIEAQFFSTVYGIANVRPWDRLFNNTAGSSWTATL